MQPSRTSNLRGDETPSLHRQAARTRLVFVFGGGQKCGKACRVFTWWSDDVLEDEQKFEGGKDGPAHVLACTLRTSR